MAGSIKVIQRINPITLQMTVAMATSFEVPADEGHLQYDVRSENLVLHQQDRDLDNVIAELISGLVNPTLRKLPIPASPAIPMVSVSRHSPSSQAV